MDFETQRRLMVEQQLLERGIEDERLLDAFLKVPREKFLSKDQVGKAYEDHPLPIGEGQTISQPFVVAYMLEALQLDPEDRVLEIGTGSGYQTTLLSRLVKEVYTIELHPKLSESAMGICNSLGCKNIKYRVGDGAEGWPEAAPFDAIIISAAAPEVPRELIREMGQNSLFILPVGDEHQELVIFSKTDGNLESRALGDVRFVPLLSPKSREGQKLK